MNINYREFAPSLDLAPFVECYWLHSFEGSEGQLSPVQKCLPLGMLEVIIHPDPIISDILIDGAWQPLPRAFFHGIYNNPVYWQIESPARLFGIRFKPGSFSQLFDVPAARQFCSFVDLEEFFGESINPLPESLYGAKCVTAMIARTEVFLSRRVTAMEQPNYIAAATSLIRSAKGNISIEELSCSLAVSPRQLQRSFKDHLGTSPKSYSRIIRFRNAFTGLQNVHEWADITHELGYADQAHFIREFREFAGEAPNGVLRHAEQYHKKPAEFTFE